MSIQTDDEAESDDAAKDDDTEEMALLDRLEVLENRLEAHSNQFDNLREQLQKEQEQRHQLERELQQKDERISELEDKVARLDSRTDLLDLVQSSDKMDGEQRSTALIQHLHKKAQTQRDRSEPMMASVNRDQAEAALQYPEVDRTTIYRDMERAVRLVGNEAVLWYDSASGGESRLKLNLETGVLPAKFTGGEEL